MHPIRPQICRRRISPPLPTALGPTVTDHQEALLKLLSYVSVPPEQFYGPRSGLASGRPEAALMRAVLVDALECFQKGLVQQGRRARRLAREAEEWLLSDDTNWPFSFVSICAVLGLEPGYLRRGLRRWRQGRPDAAVKTPPRIVSITRRLAA
jgi:hypothetical protein